MKEKIGSVHFGPIIKLNVGGRIFHTSKSTLTREKSMLSYMFSGSGFKLEKDDTGAYFIDRSGEHFEKILNYFRTGTYVPPESNETYKELKLEVEFYQIESLLHLVQVKEYKFTSLNDKEGIIYWLGTKGNTIQWTYPVAITLSTPFPSSQPAERALFSCNPSHLSGSGWCNRGSTTPVFFVVNFKTHIIQPTSYSLSYSGSCCKPNNWKLQGSNNEANWDNLTTHVDGPLKNESTRNWGITTQNYYQYFRIYCDGPDMSGHCYCFHVGAFEIYGFLKDIE